MLNSRRVHFTYPLGVTKPRGNQNKVSLWKHHCYKSMHFSFTSKLRWTPLSKFVFNFLYNVFTNLGNSHWTQTDPLETKMIVLREIKISTLWNELPPVFHRQEVHLLDRTYTYIGQLPEVTRNWTCKLNIFTAGSFSFANWLAQDLWYHRKRSWCSCCFMMFQFSRAKALAARWLLIYALIGSLHLFLVMGLVLK